MQGSAQSDQSVSPGSKTSLYYQSAFGVAFPIFYSVVSGGQNSLSDGKRRLSGSWSGQVWAEPWVVCVCGGFL